MKFSDPISRLTMLSRNAIHTLIFCVVLSGFVATDASNVFAATSTSVRLPSDSKQSIGIAVTIAAKTYDLPGYIHFDVTLSSNLGASATQQNFELRFDSTADGALPPDRGVVVNTAISLPQGATSISKVIAVPCYCIPPFVMVELVRDGQPIPGYGDKMLIEAVDPQRSITAFFNREQTYSVAKISALDQILELDQVSQQERVSIAESLSSLDALEIDAAAEFLTATGEAADLVRSAVRRYLLHGGLVVVVGEVPAVDIEQALNVSLRRMMDDRTAENVWARLDQATSSSNLNVDGLPAGLNQLAEPTQHLRPIWIRSAGPGKVVMSPQGFAVSSPLNYYLANSIPLRSSTTLVRGVEPMLGDSRFLQWMVPGVAQPPVYTFMGLLAAFVILVGPIAYRRTTRSGRGYLMFAIAPVLAILTTVIMFAYGILADGFGTIVRVRQISYSDGSSGDLGERVRSTYFAGIRPGDGLRFPSDAEVYPYPEFDERSWEQAAAGGRRASGRIDIDDEHQVFSKDFLPSRRQRQFVSTITKSNVGRLRLKFADGDEPLPQRAETVTRPGLPAEEPVFAIPDDENPLLESGKPMITPNKQGESPENQFESLGEQRIESESFGGEGRGLEPTGFSPDSADVEGPQVMADDTTRSAMNQFTSEDSGKSANRPEIAATATVTAAAIPKTPPTLFNEFEFSLRRIVLRDRGGNYWICEEIDAGANKVCEFPKPLVIGTLLGGLYNDYRPIAETRQSSRNINPYDRDLRDIIANLNRNLGLQTVQTDGVFESLIADVLKNNVELPTDYFFAIADPSPDAIAVDATVSPASVRYVFGTLAP